MRAAWRREPLPPRASLLPLAPPPSRSAFPSGVSEGAASSDRRAATSSGALRRGRPAVSARGQAGRGGGGVRFGGGLGGRGGLGWRVGGLWDAAPTSEGLPSLTSRENSRRVYPGSLRLSWLRVFGAQLGFHRRSLDGACLYPLPRPYPDGVVEVRYSPKLGWICDSQLTCDSLERLASVLRREGR